MTLIELLVATREILMIRGESASDYTITLTQEERVEAMRGFEHPPSRLIGFNVRYEEPAWEFHRRECEQADLTGRDQSGKQPAAGSTSQYR